MSYEITFTRGFKDGLEGLPRETYPIIDRQLAWIQQDPFAKNANATRMKNERSAFRVRIGIHVRMQYSVYSKQRRVELNGIGARENFYSGRHGSATPLTPAEVDAIRAELHLAGAMPPVQRPDIRKSAPVTHTADLPITVEVLDWITEDELFLMHVAPETWPAILRAGTVQGLQTCAIDERIKAQIEDYWTNPAPTQVDKLYSLSTGQGTEAISQQPLSQFLIALDPEQKEALQRLRGDGPYLVKGSAGTGKSLVGLYHVRDLITARAGESLFDTTGALFGVITYTNTLVDASQSLLKAITPPTAHGGIRCSTLDKIAYDLVEKALGAKPNALNVEGICKWIKELILPSLPESTISFVERLGADYIADEIEQVINGNGLATISDYLSQERRGRKQGLRETERRELWTVYEAFVRLCEARKVQTFEQWRVLALNYLEATPQHPRFASMFVDEAQDFSKVARRLCLALVGDSKHLVLAADTGQSIYTVPLSWRETDPRLDFRRRKPIMLQRSYRATREIGQAIAPLRMDLGDSDDVSTNASPVFSGPKPHWVAAPITGHTGIVSQEIMRLTRNGANPINAGQIAVIVRDSTGAGRFRSALSAQNIDSVIVDKNSPLRVDGHHVHIVTAHSSKGLGFPVVFVPEVHDAFYPWRFLIDRAKDSQQREQIEDNEQRLLYVALSRASHQLWMLVDPEHPSPFVSKLDREAHWS
jgi:superfamily I DNA/RNA helicase/mRNA-degrading endonuclease RelE of RelBE toxin-antitoxin system